MPSNSDLVLSEHKDGVALITLNRPDSLNALSSAMVEAIIAALLAARNDAEVRVIVLTGNGKAFCAGVDLKALTGDGSVLDDDAAFLAAFEECNKPIIGAINGFAITGGLEVAMQCDFLYAADTAKFGDTHTKVGILSTWGMSQKLARIVGINRARELSLSGNFFTANDALNWGLVNKVFSAETLVSEALKVAAQIASNDATAVAGMRGLINDGWRATLDAGLQLEYQRSRPHNDALDYSLMEERLNQVRKR